MTRKRKNQTDGYSLTEVRALTNRLIDQSVGRLRERLRASWKKQVSARRTRHGIVV